MRGASGSKINNNGVTMLKQACSSRYSGLLKLSNQRFKRASTPFLIFFRLHQKLTVWGGTMLRNLA